MKRRTRLIVFLIPLLLLAIALTFPTSAFTSTSADRSVSVSVASDQQGIVGLADGHPGSGLIEQSSNGALSIDFTLGGANGVNRDAVFTLGDQADAENDHAFRIVNQGNQVWTYNVEFDFSSGPGGSGENLKFLFYYNNNVNTISVPGGTNSVNIPNVGVGDAIYVVVIVDTNGLSQSDDLSGALEITAVEGA